MTDVAKPIKHNQVVVRTHKDGVTHTIHEFAVPANSGSAINEAFQQMGWKDEEYVAVFDPDGYVTDANDKVYYRIGHDFEVIELKEGWHGVWYIYHGSNRQRADIHDKPSEIRRHCFKASHALKGMHKHDCCSSRKWVSDIEDVESKLRVNDFTIWYAPADQDDSATAGAVVSIWLMTLQLCHGCGTQWLKQHRLSLWLCPEQASFLEERTKEEVLIHLMGDTSQYPIIHNTTTAMHRLDSDDPAMLRAWDKWKST